MMTSKTITLFICAFFLVGCVPTGQTSTPVILTATVPTTPVPTETLTIIPTTPTESGPKVGDQKTVDKITYTYMKVASPDGKHEYLGYFGPISVNGCLWDSEGYQVPVLGPDGKTLVTNSDGSLKWVWAKMLGQ